MPSLNEALGQDLSAYSISEKSSPQAAVVSAPGLEPTLNSMIRCPLPPIFQAAPDSLRQFYQGGQVPQTRLLSPIAATGSSISTTTTETVISNSSNGGSSGGSGSTTVLKSQQVSITTPSLSPNTTFNGVLLMSKSFQLLSISVNSPARVRLYGTSLSRSNDASRPLDISPPAGSTQNIICDVALDTVPYQWAFQNRVGANADTPQSGSIYLSLTNLDAVSDFVTVTFLYVPLENA